MVSVPAEYVPRLNSIVFVVFSMQLLVSYLWLSRFRYGPMEWLWRAITYWQLPAMRRESEAAPASIASPATSA